jgi:LuxR family maltose regulon positive regulatory protein
MAEKKERAAAFAKTTRPAIATLIARERLYSRLDGGSGRTLAWISGAPGSGKTSLVAGYVEARAFTVLWYQIDADDNDIATFFHYLAHAAGKIGGPKARPLPVYSEQFRSDVGAFARKFFRQLFAQAKGPLALVLDNFHLVQPESLLHAVLEPAAGQIPRGCCMIVASRAEAPPPLARLRLTGEMVCVSGDELRFDAHELEMVAKLRGQELSREAIVQLEERTRGWAAGVVLMLEHEKFSGRIPEYPRDATPKVVFDYLAGEIFDRFEPKTREFLLRVACLNRMTVPVAEALSGEAKAGRLLINLSVNDYFVSDSHSDEGRIFQLHPLLRDFLLSRAANDFPEAVGSGHLRRAAALLREAGQTEDAVSLLIESRDWPAVARIAADEAAAMLAQGRVATLSAWLELVPEALLQGSADLLYAMGACRTSSSPRAARRLFERAHEGFRAAGDETRMLASCCGVIDAFILEFDDLTGLDGWVDELDELMRRVKPPATDFDPGAPAPQESAHLKLARAMGRLLRGDFAAALALFSELGSAGTALPAHIAIETGVGTALFKLFAGEHAAALAVARENLDASRAEGIHPCDGWLHGIAAAALLAAGDLPAAREELQGARAELRRGDRSVMHYLRAWLALLEEDLALANAEARMSAELSAETGMPWLECLARVAWAQALTARGDLRGCEAQLRRAGALADRLHIPNLRFNVHLAEADAALRANDPAAKEKLATAFAFGREHGIHHVAGWRPHALADLCVFALRREIEPEYARAMAMDGGLVPKEPPVRVQGWPWAFRVSTFGSFRLSCDGAPVEFAGKGPGRPMELLKVLVARGGQGVRADQLAEALWPHVDADYAHNSFTATLHRLRKLLGDDDAVTLADARVSLNPAKFWVDTWALEQVVEELDQALRSPGPPGQAPGLSALADEIFALYRGPFLADESEQPAYIACREQIRARLLRCLARLGRAWEEAGRPDAAADCYLRCIEVDPLFEALYRNLMLAYQRCGEAIEARATYQRLSTMLAARLKAEPSPETRAVFQALAESPGEGREG